MLEITLDLRFDATPLTSNGDPEPPDPGTGGGGTTKNPSDKPGEDVLND